MSMTDRGCSSCICKRSCFGSAGAARAGGGAPEADREEALEGRSQVSPMRGSMHPGVGRT